MSFTEGFQKTATATPATYDEKAEMAKADKMAESIKAYPEASREPGATDLKVGSRVVYWNREHGGWKEGPWAHHTKFCSKDDEQREAQKAYTEKVREDVKKTHADKSMHWRVISDRVEHAFPGHHRGAWKDEAIGIGARGKITRVEQFKTQANRYHVTWDKHPDCEWGGYSPKDLKILPRGDS